jgi:hypothetical protein
MAKGAAWRKIDDFPACQEWADEVETVLSPLEEHGQFDRYLPRLQKMERDETLAEARVSYFLLHKGFRIVSWEPMAESGHPGEFEIQWKNDPPIFVEVKAPGWEGELSEEEKRIPRRNKWKLRRGVRSVNPIERVLYAARKATQEQRKFSPDRPNLLVVADDLFRSPVTVPLNTLIPLVQQGLIAFSRLGGILLFNAVCHNVVEYRARLIVNPAADPRCTLPPIAINILSSKAGPQPGRDGGKGVSCRRG